jgi:putative flavoprotein involved in K+ transport
VLARTVGVQGGRPVLDDGRVVDVRNVVWCTGFRPDFSWLHFPFQLGEDGYPVQYRGAAQSPPGLYFAGLPFLHSFASMLVAGSARDAGRIARQILKGRAPELDAEAEPALASAS